MSSTPKGKRTPIPGATLADFRRHGNSFYIWSAKHQGKREDLLFWGPRAAGYTTRMKDAGRYTAKRAYELTKGCTNPTGEGLLIADRKFVLPDVLKLGRNWGVAIAIPANKLKQIFSVRTVAKL